MAAPDNIRPIVVPQPLMSLAIAPKTEADEEKLRVGLRMLMAEDSTLRVETDRQTRLIVIAAMSELHLEGIIDRLKREFDVNASLGKPQIAYRETLTAPAEGEGRFIRQTGGRGHFGHAKIRLIPLPPGSGYQFENQVTGGSIPREYINAVDQGIREALTRGILAGYPIDDVRIELYDGSYHEIDSSEMSFKIAGSMAFQDAARKARPVLLEPMMLVGVLVPEPFLADVTGDLVGRRGQIQSQEDRGGVQMVLARAPLSEMFGYGTDLRSRTLGHATFSMSFDCYQPRPDSLDDDDGESRVGAPRKPTPTVRDSAIALPEPDENRDEI